MILGAPIYRDYRIVHSTDEGYMSFMHGFGDSKPIPEPYYFRAADDLKLKYSFRQSKNGTLDAILVSLLLGFFVGALPAVLAEIYFFILTD